MFSGFRMWTGLIIAGAPCLLHALDLKVMTFNIRNGGDRTDWNNRKAQVFALIDTSRPDVVGMQEVFKYQLDELLAALPGYTSVGVGRDDGKTAGEYSPIFFRTALFHADTSSTFWLSDTPETPGSKVPGAGNPRIDTWARLRHIGTGRTFYFHASHWDNVSAEARRLSAKLIAKRIAERKYKEDPVVFVCDCNAQPDDEPVRYLLGEGGSPIDFHSAYTELHPGVAASATFNGFRGDTLGKPIDHILSFDSVPAVDARILRDHIGSQYPSDHYPLIATLRFPATTSALFRDRKSNDGKSPDIGMERPDGFPGVDAMGRRPPTGFGGISYPE